MKSLLCLLLLAQTPDLPLEVTGDGVKTITVVSKLPFTVKAPAGADFYAWQDSDGKSSFGFDNKLDIAKATGDFTVKCSALFVDIDFKNQKVTKTLKTYSTTVRVGEPAPPVTPLILSLQAAYDSETAADKQSRTQQLAGVYTSMVGSANDVTIMTTGALRDKLSSLMSAAMPSTAIPAVRRAVGAYSNGVLPTDSNLALNRQLFASEFQRIADALRSIK